jgi:hypothetical protein
MRNGAVEVPADEFQTWVCTIHRYTYHYTHKYHTSAGEKTCISKHDRTTINIPPAIANALNLKNYEEVEIAIRRKPQEGK